MWTNEKARDFMVAEYPWFLETYDNYPQPIQRADAIRYFVLAHYGGIYIDLDDVGDEIITLDLVVLTFFRAVIVVLIPFCLTQHGCVELFPLGYQTTPWEPSRSIHSSSRSSTPCRATIGIGRSLTSLSCILPGHCSSVSSGRSIFVGVYPRKVESEY